MKIKTYLTIVGSVIAITVGCITIYNQFFVPSSKLVAKVEYLSLEYPPKLKDKIKGLFEILEKTTEKKGNNELFKNIALIEEQISENLEFEGFWNVHVKNKGNSLSENVVLAVPQSRIFLIEREEGVTVADTKDVVAIGNLRPLEEVIIYGWTNSIRSIITEKNIRLTCNKGIGKIIFLYPVNQFWYFFSRHWLILLLLVLYFIFAILNLIRIIPKKKSKGKNDPINTGMLGGKNTKEECKIFKIKAGEYINFTAGFLGQCKITLLGITEEKFNKFHAEKKEYGAHIKIGLTSGDFLGGEYVKTISSNEFIVPQVESDVLKQAYSLFLFYIMKNYSFFYFVSIYVVHINTQSNEIEINVFMHYTT